MQMNNQVKVGLTTVVCLLCQGFIFTYILKVEPIALVSIAPIFLYIAYIYARNRRVWWYHKPMYWIVAIFILTLLDIAPYAWASIT
jgi:ABC-type iron transport system FetAB permease component